MAVARERCSNGHASTVMSIGRAYENATRYHCPLCGDERVVIE